MLSYCSELIKLPLQPLTSQKKFQIKWYYLIWVITSSCVQHYAANCSSRYSALSTQASVHENALKIELGTQVSSLRDNVDWHYVKMNLWRMGGPVKLRQKRRNRQYYTISLWRVLPKFPHHVSTHFLSSSIYQHHQLKEKPLNVQFNHLKIGVNHVLYKVTVRLQLIKTKKTKPPILGKSVFFLLFRANITKKHPGLNMMTNCDRWGTTNLSFGQIFLKLATHLVQYIKHVNYPVVILTNFHTWQCYFHPLLSKL